MLIRLREVYPWTPLSELQTGESDFHTEAIEIKEAKNNER